MDFLRNLILAAFLVSGAVLVLRSVTVILRGRRDGDTDAGDEWIALAMLVAGLVAAVLAYRALFL